MVGAPMVTDSSWRSLEAFQKYMAEDLSEEGYDKWVAYAVAKSAVMMYCTTLRFRLS